MAKLATARHGAALLASGLLAALLASAVPPSRAEAGDDGAIGQAGPECDNACAARRKDCDAGCFRQQQECALKCPMAGSPEGVQKCLAECAARGVQCGATCMAQDEACKLACRAPPPLPLPPLPSAPPKK